MSKVFGRKSIRQKRERQYQVDLWSYLFIMVALVLAFFVDSVYADANPVLSAKAKSQSLWIIAGLVLALSFGVASGGRWMPIPEFDVELDDDEAQRAVLWTLIGIVVLGVTSYVVLQAASFLGLSALTPTDTAQRAIAAGFLTVSAVGEECFFRFALYGGLSTFLANTRYGRVNKSFTATATSLIFVAYHAGVYGTDVDLLWVVFVNSIFLCIIYDYTKRLSVVMAVHVWNNLLAAGAIQILLGLV